MPSKKKEVAKKMPRDTYMEKQSRNGKLALHARRVERSRYDEFGREKK